MPLQVDELNFNGDIVLSGGQPFTANTDDGIIDGNDEISFFGSDLGDSFTADEISHFIQKRALSTWHLEVCGKKSHLGHALLVAVNAKHEDPHRFAPKVRFEAISKVVQTEHYEYRFDKKNSAMLGDVFFKKSGKTHKVFDGFDFLIAARTPWWMPSMYFTQDDFKSTVESWQEGPVRTIIAVGAKFNNFLSVFSYHMFSELAFYPKRFSIPSGIEMPMNAGKYLKAGSGIAYAIKPAKSLEWDVVTNVQDLPKKDPELVINHTDNSKSWPPFFYLNGMSSLGSFRAMVQIDPQVIQKISPPFVLKKHHWRTQKSYKSWKILDKIHGDLGFFVDLSTIPAGNYHFGLDLVLSSEAYHEFKDLSEIESVRYSPTIRELSLKVKK